MSQESLELHFVGLPREVASFEVACFDAASVEAFYPGFSSLHPLRGRLGASRRGNLLGG